MRERLGTTSDTVPTMEGFETKNITNQSLQNGHLEHQNLSSAKFNGLVKQKNGSWAAQIYVNCKRYWLGVFKTEKGAAMAYDSAAIKLRGWGTSRNLPWTELTNQELSFQNLYSAEEILNMIKYKSYDSRLAEYLASQPANKTNNNNGQQLQGDLEMNIFNQKDTMYHRLFQKELTRSDLGNLCKLLIPIKHATRYFPQLTDGVCGPEQNHQEYVYLEFLDRKMNLWKFRYCYWKSSKSYVLTTSWNKFVKEKKLKEKETIAFYKFWSKESSSSRKPFFVVDIGGNGENARNETESEVGRNQRKVDLQHGSEGFNRGNGEGTDMRVPKKVKLFGVFIN